MSFVSSNQQLIHSARATANGRAEQQAPTQGMTLFITNIILTALCSQALAFSARPQLKPPSRISYLRAPAACENNFNDGHSTIDNGKAMVNTASRKKHVSRRDLFSQIACVAPASVLFQSQGALAAPPLTPEETDNFAARAERALRPKPPKVLRTRMNIDFAGKLLCKSIC